MNVPLVPNSAINIHSQPGAGRPAQGQVTARATQDLAEVVQSGSLPSVKPAAAPGGKGDDRAPGRKHQAASSPTHSISRAARSGSGHANQAGLKQVNSISGM
jgi:hypothetical protein